MAHSMLDDYDISSEEYLKLYERFLSRPVDDLLLVSGDLNGKRVLDLCAGTLRASNRAKELGAEFVVALDKSNKIIPKTHKADRVIICDVFDMEEDPEIWKLAPFDLIVCQQAINYLFNYVLFESITKLLSKNGTLVFNTFNKKPSTIPEVREYELGGDKLIETIQLVGDVVYHQQMRTGYRPHCTSFYWFEPEYISEVLSHYFTKVNNIMEGNTSIYVCNI